MFFMFYMPSCCTFFKLLPQVFFILTSRFHCSLWIISFLLVLLLSPTQQRRKGIQQPPPPPPISPPEIAAQNTKRRRQENPNAQLLPSKGRSDEKPVFFLHRDFRGGSQRVLGQFALPPRHKKANLPKPQTVYCLYLGLFFCNFSFVFPTKIVLN